MSGLTAGQWFLLVMAIMYLLAAVAFAVQTSANYGVALTMLCYGVANLGMLWGVK